MPRPRKRNDLPLTVSARLLVDGSDAQFRDFILDLLAYSHRLDACRSAFAGILGVSPAQYDILMLVSRSHGISVGEAAARLHRSGAFITIECNKLVERGVLEKYSDPDDGRKVLLRAARKSRAMLERLAPYQVRVNDVLFGNVGAKRFRELRSMTRELLASGDRAVVLLDYIMQEAA
jgi:MarR family transcriptional regulator, organic hydroperoxide resistance regulator